MRAAYQLFVFPTVIVFHNFPNKNRVLDELTEIVQKKIKSYVSLSYTGALADTAHVTGGTMIVAVMPDDYVNEENGTPMRNMLLDVFKNAFAQLSAKHNIPAFALHFEICEYAIVDINDQSMYDVFYDDAKRLAHLDLLTFHHSALSYFLDEKEDKDERN